MAGSEVKNRFHHKFFKGARCFLCLTANGKLIGGHEPRASPAFAIQANYSRKFAKGPLILIPISPFSLESLSKRNVHANLSCCRILISKANAFVIFRRRRRRWSIHPPPAPFGGSSSLVSPRLPPLNQNRSRVHKRPYYVSDMMRLFQERWVKLAS